MSKRKISGKCLPIEVLLGKEELMVNHFLDWKSALRMLLETAFQEIYCFSWNIEGLWVADLIGDYLWNITKRPYLKGDGPVEKLVG